MENTLANDPYNPRKIIAGHFINIIDKINEQTNNELIILKLKYTKTPETIANPDDQKELISRQNELEKLRNEQINKVNEIAHLNELDFKEDEFKTKRTTIISNPSLDEEQKIEKILEEIISYDCILLEQGKVKNGLDLWTTPWFNNRRNRKFLEYNFIF
jgi:hypothetical protein